MHCTTAASLEMSDEPDFLLSQSQVSLSDGNAGVVEKLHQLYQCQFGTLTTIHVVNLSPECLTQGVTAKVTDLQTVLLFQVFQNAVDPLDAESGTFLTNQDR